MPSTWLTSFAPNSPNMPGDHFNSPHSISFYPDNNPMGVDSITVLTLRLSGVTQAHPISCSIRLTWEFTEAISIALPRSISTHPPTRVSGEIPEPPHPTSQTYGGCCIVRMGSWEWAIF